MMDRSVAFALLSILAVTALLVTASAPTANAWEASTLQALVVTTAGWSSPDAHLSLYERKDTRSGWLPARSGIQAVVGRNGMAWGRGLHPDPGADALRKREGDGKSPAGVFRLGAAFGDASPASVPWIGLSYRQTLEGSRCVDDPSSAFYNRLIEEGAVRKDWMSSESMRRGDGQYRLGLLVGHNREPVEPEAGSCIFLHIWAGPSVGTSGCTALSAADVERILRWLRAEADPVLIQLPEQEYRRLRRPWGLPGP